MGLARHVATWSKDRSRQFGAVIVNDREVPVALGWNGFPRGVDDDVEERHQRPEKYLWTVHAEENAIANAAAEGASTRGCRIYVPWFPCAPCFRKIIQAGITHMICVEPDWNDPTYADDFRIVREMCRETKLRVTFMPGVSPAQKPLAPTICAN